MVDDIQQPAWGRLIEDKRKEMRPRVSARKAALMASLSEGRWRQITKGYQAVGGAKAPVRGPAETIARMAQVVGVTADELEAAGRADAADELRSISERFPAAESGEAIADGVAVLAELEEWMNASREAWPGPPPTEALSFWETDQLLEVIKQRLSVWELRARQGQDVIRQLEEQLEATRSDPHDPQDAYGLAANDTDEGQQEPGAPEDDPF